MTSSSKYVFCTCFPNKTEYFVYCLCDLYDNFKVFVFRSSGQMLIRVRDYNIELNRS